MPSVLGKFAPCALLAFIALSTIISTGCRADDSAIDCPLQIEAPKQLRLFKIVPQQDPCIGQGTRLLATTSNRILYICENGQSVQDFDFAMGILGAGKMSEGDLKTPLGTYRLGPAHVSQFGLFIPVGYPTAQQAAQGFTGSDIGIHGPKRPFRCGGFLNVSVNWTDGCLALADDSFVNIVAGWLEAHPRNAILTVE